MISSEVILHVQMHFSQKNSQKVNLNPFFLSFFLFLYFYHHQVTPHFTVKKKVAPHFMASAFLVEHATQAP